MATDTGTVAVYPTFPAFVHVFARGGWLCPYTPLRDCNAAMEAQEHDMRVQTRFAFIMIFSLSAWAADTASGADVLNRWVGGKWLGSGQFVDSAYSKANTATATTKCAWSPDHIFVVCDQDIVFGGQPMRDLSIYTFVPKNGRYYFYGIS